MSEQKTYESEHQKVNVLDLNEGDMVDLAKCPYLKNHPMADFVYAEVCYVRNESIVAAVGYEGIDEVGYDKKQELWVKKDTHNSIVENEMKNIAQLMYEKGFRYRITFSSDPNDGPME